MESKYLPSKLKKSSFFNGNKKRANDNTQSLPAKKGRFEQTQNILYHQRKSLPVYRVRNRLLEEIKKNNTLIIIGETGSGKTTQIPQFIYEERLERDDIIAITQPRRVAAITLSRRVAQEMSTNVGELVGFSVRFENVTSRNTKVKYMTDGMLLREAMLDPLLLDYRFIILDEAHERTVSTDILFGIVKTAQKERERQNLKQLKVIVMSATMDVDHFSNYFGKAPVVYLEGRQHPVDIFYAEQTQEDYVFSCLVTVFQLHKKAPANHDFLVFLTGQEEIEAMAFRIKQVARELQGKFPGLRVCPLFASLPQHQQMEAFRPTPVGMRKIVLCTNIAETSVTIPGIRYIIDSGMVKARSHQPGTGLDLLRVQRISQAQAMQRSGRAGREAPGSCYRVYTEKDFKAFLKDTIPEIKRSNLSSVVLQMLALKINILNFDFLDKPPNESITAALQQLKQLGAIESITEPHLTYIGRQMVKFPLDPSYSKLLLSAKDYRCLDEVLSITAVLSSESILITPSTKREEANSARQKFISSAGDHITLLNIFKNFNKVTHKKEWCHENFLNPRNLFYANEVRNQLAAICERSNIPMQSCGTDTELVRKCLLTGLFMNIAQLQRDRQYLTVDTRQPVSIHPSSVLFGSRPSYVLFSELVQTGKSYLRQLSIVEPEWLLETAPNYAKKHKLNFQ